MFQAKVVLWLAAHKKEVSPYDLRTFNFLTPDVPLQPNEWVLTLQSGILYKIAIYLKFISYL